MKAGAETQEGGWTPLCAEGALKAVVAACSPCAICTSTATSYATALLPAPQSHTGEIDVSTDRSCLKGLCGAPTSTSSPAMPSQSPSPQHALSWALTRARWLQKIPPQRAGTTACLTPCLPRPNMLQGHISQASKGLLGPVLLSDRVSVSLSVLTS